MEWLLSRIFGSKWRRRLLLIGGLAVLFWVTFFDSHSLLKRWQLHREQQELVEQNTALEQEIERLGDALEEVESDEAVESVAREQYGMRREGETVHRVVETDK